MGLILSFLPTTPLQVQAQPLVSCKDGSAPGNAATAADRAQVCSGKGCACNLRQFKVNEGKLSSASHRCMGCSYLYLTCVAKRRPSVQLQPGREGQRGYHAAGRMEERGSIPAGAAAGDAKLSFVQGPAAGTSRTQRGFVHGDLLTSTGHFTEKRSRLYGGRVFMVSQFPSQRRNAH